MHTKLQRLKYMRSLRNQVFAEVAHCYLQDTSTANADICQDLPSESLHLFREWHSRFQSAIDIRWLMFRSNWAPIVVFRHGLPISEVQPKIFKIYQIILGLAIIGVTLRAVQFSQLLKFRSTHMKSPKSFPSLVVLVVMTCGLSSSMVQGQRPKDVNHDHLVDGVVLAQILSTYGTNEGSVGSDINGDGIVNSRDIAIALGAASQPNILVIVLDDLGIDQMSFPPYNWNAAPEAPAMPVLAEIASKGVSFRKFWATPECSPSRAAMLTGRHGFRTGVVTGLIDPMLPSNQLHPSEITVPMLLKAAGYTSGMVGKYHLAGGESNTAPGYWYQAPNSTLGLDFYEGYWDLPPSVDMTIGGQAAEGTYDCGTIGGVNTRGAACFPNGSCIENIHPLDAMAMGATPLLKSDGTLAATCAEGSCSAVDFTQTNAYYVWPRITTTPTSAERAKEPQREYLTSFISRRTAEWIAGARKAGKPWLAFSMHSSAHTPIQPPPPSLTGPAESNLSCAFTGLGFRNQYRLMVESVDTSIGNMLVELGLGSRVNGTFVLGDLVAANTMILVVNDNGTFGYDVLPPFALNRAKQTVYETGVRSPCIIAGPQVVAPGRAVDETVSIADLFGLLCETAGVDWTTVQTPSRHIDCVPMMPFLTNPAQGPIREFNFAQYRQGIFPANTVGTCVTGGTVIDGLMTSPGLCVANGGCWLGGADSAPYPITNYCDLLSTDPSKAIVECGGVNYCFLPPDMSDQCAKGSTAIQPPTIAQYAVRRGQWKLVVRQLPACLAPNDCDVRLYLLAEPVPPLQPGIEGADGDQGVWNPLKDTMPLVAQAEYQALKNELVRLLLSEPKSLADGNLDGVVDAADLTGIFCEWGSMGFWDATQDGIVNGEDLAIVLTAWGTVPPSLDVVPSCLLGGAQ